MTVMNVCEFNVKVNVSSDDRVKNIEANRKRGLPELTRPKHEKGRPVAIIGAGPSINDFEKDILGFKGAVWTVNHTHDWLIERGRIPDAMVLIDAHPEMVECVQKPHKGVRYLVSSVCHPDVFDALQGYDVTLWHQSQNEIEIPDAMTVDGGSSVLLRAIPLAHVYGFREAHIFGADCCFRDGRDHGTDQPNQPYKRIKVSVGFPIGDGKYVASQKVWETNPTLACLAKELCDLAWGYGDKIGLTIYGDHLTGEMARYMDAGGGRLRRVELLAA